MTLYRNKQTRKNISVCILLSGATRRGRQTEFRPPSRPPPPSLNTRGATMGWGRPLSHKKTEKGPPPLQKGKKEWRISILRKKKINTFFGASRNIFILLLFLLFNLKKVSHTVFALCQKNPIL